MFVVIVVVTAVQIKMEHQQMYGDVLFGSKGTIARCV